MAMYYCLECGTVRVFDEQQIRKHGLKPPNEQDCPVCKDGLYLPLRLVSSGVGDITVS